MAINLLAFMGAYAWLASQQVSGSFLSQTVYVDFGDEIIPFLGIFSGCYSITKDTSDNRHTYRQLGYETDGGLFAFCQDVDGSPAWTFSAGTNQDPCVDWQAKSGLTEEFELYIAGKENW